MHFASFLSVSLLVSASVCCIAAQTDSTTSTPMSFMNGTVAATNVSSMPSPSPSNTSSSASAGDVASSTTLPPASNNASVSPVMPSSSMASPPPNSTAVETSTTTTTTTTAGTSSTTTTSTTTSTTTTTASTAGTSSSSPSTAPATIPPSSFPPFIPPTPRVLGDPTYIPMVAAIVSGFGLLALLLILFLSMAFIYKYLGRKDSSKVPLKSKKQKGEPNAFYSGPGAQSHQYLVSSMSNQSFPNSPSESGFGSPGIYYNRGFDGEGNGSGHGTGGVPYGENEDGFRPIQIKADMSVRPRSGNTSNA